MISTVTREEVEAKKTRAASAVNDYILRELETLKEHLKKNRSVRNFAPLKIDFQDVPQGQPNPKNALTKFRALARNYISNQGLELRIVGGQESPDRKSRARKDVLFIIPGKEPAPKRGRRRAA